MVFKLIKKITGNKSTAKDSQPTTSKNVEAPKKVEQSKKHHHSNPQPRHDRRPVNQHQSAPAKKPEIQESQYPQVKDFASLKLSSDILKAIQEEGYTVPTPIQSQSIPPILEGRDLLGCAQTGTGKTAAFALPILHRITEGKKNNAQAQTQRAIKALILAPTRELALQIQSSFETYGKYTKCRSTVVFGGVGLEPQIDRVRKGVDVLVATPGRLLDLMNRGAVKLNHLEILVLDEADRMLDMGFIHDIRRVLKVLPVKRQNLLLSATIPNEVKNLIDSILIDPVSVKVNPVSSTSERVTQRAYFVARGEKKNLLMHIIRDEQVKCGLVFARTKYNANKLETFLNSEGVKAAAIHGNKSQSARQRALEQFRSGHLQILVASDIAARGIDIDGITHVINFEFPNEPETYVHRIGRTGRAEATGVALSFCDSEERTWLRSVEKLTGVKVAVIEHPFMQGADEPVMSALIRQHRGGKPSSGRRHSGKPKGSKPQSNHRRPR
jgi:ATP-dependent RNA helicase RhlE